MAGIFFGGRAWLSYYVDVLWFGSLGYEHVFWKTLSLQWGIFLGFAAATLLIVYRSFLALKRAHLPDLPSGHTIYIGGQALKLPVEPVLRLTALGVSLIIAAAVGASMMAEWPTLALFWYAPPSTGGGVLDPIFGKPLHFFLLILPAWQLIAGWPSNRPSAKGIVSRETIHPCSVVSPSVGFHVSLTVTGYCGPFPPGSMVVLAELPWSELIHCVVHFLRGGFAVSVHNSAPSCSFSPC